MFFTRSQEPPFWHLVLGHLFGGSPVLGAEVSKGPIELKVCVGTSSRVFNAFFVDAVFELARGTTNASVGEMLVMFLTTVSVGPVVKCNN